MMRLVAAVLLLTLAACAPPRPNYPVIGAKNFTEQVVLGELLAQHIEAVTGLKVERRFYLAGSYICNQALIAGRIDSYGPRRVARRPAGAGPSHHHPEPGSAVQSAMEAGCGLRV